MDVVRVVDFVDFSFASKSWIGEGGFFTSTTLTGSTRVVDMVGVSCSEAGCGTPDACTAVFL